MTCTPTVHDFSLNTKNNLIYRNVKTYSRSVYSFCTGRLVGQRPGGMFYIHIMYIVCVYYIRTYPPYVYIYIFVFRYIDVKDWHIVKIYIGNIYDNLSNKNIIIVMFHIPLGLVYRFPVFRGHAQLSD